MARYRCIRILQAVFFATIVDCFGFEGPQPTQALQKLQQAPVPAPTSPASLAERDLNLVVRQNNNPTCGYLTGDANYPLTCGAGYICATEANYDAAGCCNADSLDTCLLPSTCIPNGGVCDEECYYSNYAITSCGYEAPYCLTKEYVFDYLYYEYDCATEGGTYTIYPSATNVPTNAAASQFVVTTAAEIVATRASSAAAVTAQQSGGGTEVCNDCVINDGPNNSCGNDSQCGSGNNNNQGGTNNHVGSNGGASCVLKPRAQYLWSLLLVGWAILG